MSNEQPDYVSYLLRLWRENTEQTTWRASLERSRTAKRQVFPSLHDLFEYLRQRTGMALETDKDDGETATGCQELD